MSRYVGPVGASADAIMTRSEIGALIDTKVDAALAELNLGGGAVNPTYVRATATGAGNGSDFNNAYAITNLGTAIANTAPGGNVNILATDSYTGLGNISLASYTTQHLSAGNGVSIRGTNAAGAVVYPINQATLGDYITPAEALAGWNATTKRFDTTVLDSAFIPDNADFAGGLWLTGTRTADPRTTEDQWKVPIDATKWTTGSPMFILNGVSHLTFVAIGFLNVGNGCFQFNGPCTNINFTDCAGRNVYRWVETTRGGNAQRTEYWDGGTDLRSDVRGVARGYRINNQSKDVDIDDLFMDCRRVYQDSFPTGVQLGDGNSFYSPTSTPPGVNNIRVRGVSRLAVVANAFDGRDPGSYRNGDGVAAESQASFVTLENTMAAGFTDGGIDLKSENNTLNNFIAYDCKRNIRLWRTNTYNNPVYVIAPRKRGGTGGAHAVHLADTIFTPQVTFGDLRIDMSSAASPIGIESGAVTVNGGSIRYGDQAANTPASVATIGGGVDVAAIATVTPQPAEPWRLSAGGASDTTASLSWAPETEHANTWQYELDGSGTWNAISGATGTSTSGTITGLTPSTTYSIRIRAVNTASVAGRASLASSATTLGAAVSSFSDDHSVDLLAANYDYYGAYPNVWQFEGNGTVRGAAPSNNGWRIQSPRANLGANHRSHTVVTGYDSTVRPGVMVRVNNGSGVAFVLDTSSTWKLIPFTSGAVAAGGSVRTVVQTVPALPFTMSIEVTGDAYVCKIDGVTLDWGGGETSVTVAGYSGNRIGRVCYDDDAFFGTFTGTAL